jgi:hypothetical protein
MECEILTWFHRKTNTLKLKMEFNFRTLNPQVVIQKSSQLYSVVCISVHFSNFFVQTRISLNFCSGSAEKALVVMVKLLFGGSVLCKRRQRRKLAPGRGENDARH